MIALTGVSASLGARQVLNNVSLAVGAGELVALCGPNGAGKSSVLRAACGLLAIQAGEVQLGEQEIGSLSASQRAERLAYLPQDRRIAWNMPAIEIAALGLPYLAATHARDRAMQALIELEAGHLAERGVADMSGGERARVLIARTLTTHAKTLALDEPVAGLDPDAQFLVMERLTARAAAGQAVIVSLHDLELAAEWADRVVVIDQGRAVADGPPPAVLTPTILQDVFRISGTWLEDEVGASLRITGRHRRD